MSAFAAVSSRARCFWTARRRALCVAFVALPLYLLAAGRLVAFERDRLTPGAAEGDDHLATGASSIPCSVTPSFRSGDAPVPVTFHLSGLTAEDCAEGESAAFRCTWDFGDGQRADGPGQVHEYPHGGTFLWSFSATHRSGGAECDQRGTLTLPTANSLRLASGRVEVTVSYRNQYAATVGEGIPVSSGDNAGYFYFFRRQVPEVAVKVLDFGPTTPFLLFVSSLSDFEQLVSFTNLENGKTKTFPIAAGSTLRASDHTLRLFSTIDTTSLTR